MYLGKILTEIISTEIQHFNDVGSLIGYIIRQNRNIYQIDTTNEEKGKIDLNGVLNQSLKYE